MAAKLIFGQKSRISYFRGIFLYQIWPKIHVLLSHVILDLQSKRIKIIFLYWNDLVDFLSLSFPNWWWQFRQNLMDLGWAGLAKFTESPKSELISVSAQSKIYRYRLASKITRSAFLLEIIKIE